MSKNKNIKEQIEEQIEEQVDQPVEESQETKEESQESREEALEKRIAELEDKNLRMMAEFDNYRRRTNKEKLELMSTAGERIFTEMLPLIDDFERALAALNGANGENGDAALNGVCKKLIDGVLYIVKDGKVFDARGARIQ